MGELARSQTLRGLPATKVIPWDHIIKSLLAILSILIFSGYLIGVVRTLRGRFSAPITLGGRAYQATLDRIAGGGLPRQLGESREAYAARLISICPSMPALTAAHMAWALGHESQRAIRGTQVFELAQSVRREYASTARWRWLSSIINPFAWTRTR